jgi:hypothetical protein
MDVIYIHFSKGMVIVLCKVIMNNPAPKYGPSNWAPKHKIKMFSNLTLTVQIKFLPLMKAMTQNRTAQLAPTEK